MSTARPLTPVEGKRPWEVAFPELPLPESKRSKSLPPKLTPAGNDGDVTLNQETDLDRAREQLKLAIQHLKGTTIDGRLDPKSVNFLLEELKEAFKTDPFPSDADLYKRELESIRRPEPLLKIKQVSEPIGTDQLEVEQATSLSVGGGCMQSRLVISEDDIERFTPNILAPTPEDNEEFRGESTRHVQGSRHSSNDGESYYLRDFVSPFSDNAIETIETEDLAGAGDVKPAPFARLSSAPTSGYGSSHNPKDDSDNTLATSHPVKEESPHFYGIEPNDCDEKLAELRYQVRDISEERGYFPSPSTGLRLRLGAYLAEMGIKERGNLEFAITRNLRFSIWGVREVHNFEDALTRFWKTDPEAFIAKGLPLVEDVEFVVLGNHQPDTEWDGDCYWRAVAYSLHGTDAEWMIVKAEHLGYMYHVLTNKSHPRHEYYDADLNAIFFSTHTSSSDTPSFRANLWQVLHMPHVWTPALMQQVTADLYNVHIVTFHMSTHDGVNDVTNISIQGAYNARHIFMALVNENHFQPMVPNEYWA
ncbi:hypothetical protein K449DRAFT_421299 [Hypoxylon sp. EC38]|nr:hypothetical protein K449DRAFT_421299 [Hypoxylon sp. EC38]